MHKFDQKEEPRKTHAHKKGRKKVSPNDFMQFELTFEQKRKSESSGFESPTSRNSTE